MQVGQPPPRFSDQRSILLQAAVRRLCICTSTRLARIPSVVSRGNRISALDFYLLDILVQAAGSDPIKTYAAKLTRPVGSLIRNQVDFRGAARSTNRQDSPSHENCQGSSGLFVEVAAVEPRATTIKLQLAKSSPEMDLYINYQNQVNFHEKAGINK